MKQFFLNALFLISMVLTVNATAERPFELIEEALETDALIIKLSNDLTGVARGKRCDRCEIEVVSITPETKLFVKGVPKNLIDAQKVSGKPGTVLYNIKTRKVTRIMVY